MQVGFRRPVPLVTRHACHILKALAGSEAAGQLQPSTLAAVHRALAGVLCSSCLRLQDWFSAAEAAIKAVYALHPAPQVPAISYQGRLCSSP